mmetsp:Transcript_110728/g.318270  ORF Transcript_110728/g.318270 Transcript_110728/m.318270 type:complete len:259 (+) Transcript_110728:42-818(+)
MRDTCESLGGSGRSSARLRRGGGRQSGLGLHGRGVVGAGGQDVDPADLRHVEHAQASVEHPQAGLHQDHQDPVHAHRLSAVEFRCGQGQEAIDAMEWHQCEHHRHEGANELNALEAVHQQRLRGNHAAVADVEARESGGRQQHDVQEGLQEPRRGDLVCPGPQDARVHQVGDADEGGEQECHVHHAHRPPVLHLQLGHVEVDEPERWWIVVVGPADVNARAGGTDSQLWQGLAHGLRFSDGLPERVALEAARRGGGRR